MDEFLGTDVAFSEDNISTTYGDADTVTGRKCLAQDLANRLTTPRGDLWCHEKYGMDIYRFMHLEDNLINRLDLVQSVEAETLEDPRVESADVSIKSWNGKKVVVKVSATPVDGTSPINLVLGYDLATITMEVVTGE